MQKKKILMQFLIFFCYELSVCPLILKSDKVYFASSLIAKPSGRALNDGGHSRTSKGDEASLDEVHRLAA